MFVAIASILLFATVAQGRILSELIQHNGLNVTKDYKFCSDPVTKAEVKFPESLAGRVKIDFKMYSGYIPVSDSPDYLFYWFFESQDKPDTDPIILWTNGGPGCTAMEGATTEHGPLSLFMMKESCSNGGADSKCDYTGQLSTNSYAWNKHANVLYLDQPKNVGYSFGYGKQPSSTQEAAEDVVTFYNKWLKEFPEFTKRKLIIAGESYGGHYIPAWSNAFLNYNDKQDDENKINLSGLVIGNGCVNDTVQGTKEFVQFQHNENLIPATSNPKTMAAAYVEMDKHLGYSPNYYDYRIESIDCPACYSYNYTAWSLWFLQEEVLTALNVCGEAGEDAFAGTAGGCISMGAYDVNDKFDYSGALARTLEAGIPVTLFYGKTDIACNYVGGQKLVDTISWANTDKFAKTELSPWEISDVEAGQVKSYGGLTFIQVESAGHMVPMDQPSASAKIINDFLKQL